MTGRLAGIILAGGLSRRMGGGDKTLYRIGERSMLERIIERLRPQVTELAINANGDPARLREHGLEIVADPIEGHPGPLAGILAGLQWAADRPGLTHIVTVPCDTPFFPVDLAARLFAANQGSESRIVLAASTHGLHPVVGLWPIALAGALESHVEAGNAKVTGFVDLHEHHAVEFPPIAWSGGWLDPFFNVNRPEDLELARRFAVEETR